MLASGQVRYVGDDPLITPGKQGCGLGQPLGNNSSLLLFLALLLLQRLLQCTGKFIPLHNLGGIGFGRIEQAAQHRCILEGIVHPVEGDGEVLFPQAELLPFLFRHADGQARAGDIQFRQGSETYRLRPTLTPGPSPSGRGEIRVFPRGQGQGKGGQLHAALVQFQAMDVFP